METNMMNSSCKEDLLTVNELKKGDMNAWGKLYKKYNHGVFTKIKLSLGNSDLSYDLMMDVFMKVYARINQYDGKSGAFSSWIYTITQHQIIDYTRGKHNSSTQSLFRGKNEDIEMIQVKDTANNCEETLELNQKKLRLRKAIEKYISCNKSKRALLMYYMNEMSYNEISETLHEKLNTVRSYIHRAKQILKVKASAMLL